MRNAVRLLLSLIALVQIGNFTILKLYGDALQSTHLFIVRGTVFYPVAGLNLILGVLLSVFLVWEWLNHRKMLDFMKGNQRTIVIIVLIIIAVFILTYWLLRSLGW